MPPSGHFSHFDQPSKLKVLSGHASHDRLPSEDDAVPSAHGSHCSAS